MILKSSTCIEPSIACGQVVAAQVLLVLAELLGGGGGAGPEYVRAAGPDGGEDARAGGVDGARLLLLVGVKVLVLAGAKLLMLGWRCLFGGLGGAGLGGAWVSDRGVVLAAGRQM